MKLLQNLEIDGGLRQGETGPEAQVGDQVKMILDQEANPDLPEFIFGVIQQPIKEINCGETTVYSIEYDEADLDGAQLILRPQDVVQLETTSGLDVVAGDLDDEVARALAAEALLAPKANPVFTGVVTVPTPATVDDSTKAANTAYVQNQSYVRYDAQTLDTVGQLQAQENIGIPNAVVEWDNLILFASDSYPSVNWDTRTLATDSGASLVWNTAGIQLPSGKHIQFAGVGGQIAISAAQRFAFHGGTPVIQRASALQAAVPTTPIAGAIGANPTQAEYATAVAQINALTVLVNELRASIVEKGLIKGSV